MMKNIYQKKATESQNNRALIRDARSDWDKAKDFFDCEGDIGLTMLPLNFDYE